MLDLYAGSGALGLEAASRGAASVVLVESDRRAADVIAGNARDLALPAVRVVRTTVAAHLAPDPPADSAADLVFVDPPYDLDEPALASSSTASPPAGSRPAASVVVERSTRSPEPPLARHHPAGHQTQEVRRDHGLVRHRPDSPSLGTPGSAGSGSQRGGTKRMGVPTLDPPKSARRRAREGRVGTPIREGRRRDHEVVTHKRRSGTVLGHSGPMTEIEIPRPTSGDVLERILEDHRLFEDLLREARRTDTDRAAARDALAEVLVAHATAEEEKVYPTLRTKRPSRPTTRSTARRSTPRSSRRCWSSSGPRAPTPRSTTTRSRSSRRWSTTTRTRRSRRSSTRPARTSPSSAARSSAIAWLTRRNQLLEEGCASEEQVAAKLDEAVGEGVLAPEEAREEADEIEDEAKKKAKAVEEAAKKD